MRRNGDISRKSGDLRLRLVAIVLLAAAPLFSQPENRIVHLADFRPQATAPDAATVALIRRRIEAALSEAGYEVAAAQGSTLPEQLRSAQAAGARYLVAGFYGRAQIGNLNLFTQIYNTETQSLIDAYNVADELEGIADLQLDPSELRETDERRMDRLADGITVALRANPEAVERRDNIDEYVLSSPVARAEQYPIREVDVGQRSEEVFRILQADRAISIASNVVTGLEKQPASISVIERRQIRLSGARTLNELLNLFVPGYFMVEDQDDVIGAFRGFAPDSNSKILLLINGQNMNTEWFWGPPDGVMQGMDLEYIERVEVVRGPGSVTLGQGALLGVINIVTRKGKPGENLRITGGGGQDGFNRATISHSQTGQELRDLRSFVYLSRVNYNGQRLRAEGWARDKNYETAEGEFDIFGGLYTREKPSVTANNNRLRLWPLEDGSVLFLNKNVATSGSRLKKSDSLIGMSVIEYRGLEFTGLYLDQQRDNYNFYRDRNELQNILKSANAVYRHEFGERLSLTARGAYTEDDLILHSHRGRTMGGTREYRYGGSLILNVRGLPKDNNLAVGVEYRRYDMGHTDRNGNNNIINNADDSLFDINNRERTYVFTDSIRVESFFAEDFYSLTNWLDIFAAFRYDRHEFWGYNISPRLGALAQVNDDLRLRASYQQGFRGAPGVTFAGGFRRDGLLRADNYNRVGLLQIPTTDRFGNDAYQRDVPEAQPETLDNYELAANYTIGSGWSLDTVFFYNIVRNIVDVGVIFADASEYTMPSIGSDLPGDWNGYFFFRNLPGEIRNGGVEATLSYRSERWTAALSHANVRVLSASRVLFDEFNGGMYLAGDSANQRARAYPENVSRLNLIVSVLENLDVSMNALYYWAWYSPLGDRVIGQLTFNAGILWAINENMELTVEGKNLSNQGALWPMNSNAGGPDNASGAPGLEEPSWWATLTVKL